MILGITPGLGFLDNPTRQQHPVDTYSKAVMLLPRAAGSYHVPGFCLALDLGTHSSPGYLEDAVRVKYQIARLLTVVKEPALSFSVSILDQAR
jgi:hypothetical protein